jgi:Domain of unknown function (DUF932)
MSTIAETTPTSTSFAHAGFETRMDVLKQLADMTGVRLPNTIIPEGESLIPYGQERQRALKEDIYSLPTLNQAFEALYNIRNEQAPQDVKVPVQRVRMSQANGGLYGLGHDPAKALAYSTTAFGHVGSFVKPASVTSGFHQTLLALPPAIRADAFNSFAERATENRDVVMRTIKSPVRTSSGALQLRRSINAVVSERYTGVEDHDLVRDLGYALPDGARVRYTQTESRSDLEIIWPAMSRELKVGDIALIAIQVTNSQTKQAAIRLTPKVLRVLCLNFTTAWGKGDEYDISVRHVGEARAKFAAAIRDCIAVVEPFVRAFGDAYQSEFPTIAPTRGEVIRRFIAAAKLPEQLGERMADLWDADGTMSAGNTLAGLANAATRASQTYAFAMAEPVEAYAGRVIREGWSAIGIG